MKRFTEEKTFYVVVNVTSYVTLTMLTLHISLDITNTFFYLTDFKFL